jgi:hypothetical protein
MVRLPHGSAETGVFKVYVHNTGSSIFTGRAKIRRLL